MKKSRKGTKSVSAVADLGFARVDLQRRERQGVGEVIYAPGKTPEQIAADGWLIDFGLNLKDPFTALENFKHRLLLKQQLQEGKAVADLGKEPGIRGSNAAAVATEISGRSISSAARAEALVL